MRASALPSLPVRESGLHPGTQLWSPCGPCRQSLIKPWARTRHAGAHNPSEDPSKCYLPQTSHHIASWPTATGASGCTNVPVQGAAGNTVLQLAQQFAHGAQGLSLAVPLERSSPEPTQPWGCSLTGGSGHSNLLGPSRARSVLHCSPLGASKAGLSAQATGGVSCLPSRPSPVRWEEGATSKVGARG